MMAGKKFKTSIDEDNWRLILTSEEKVPFPHNSCQIHEVAILRKEIKHIDHIISEKTVLVENWNVNKGK